MINLESRNPKGFFTNPRRDDPRIGDLVQLIDEEGLTQISPACVLLGYPDDEGIQRNFGREGSREAPDAIRSCFYRLTPGQIGQLSLYDLGNLRIFGDLSSKQKRARALTSQVFAKHRLLSLGGGHDFAYPDVAGFLDVYKKRKPLVINIDAHLDVRSAAQGPHSGSPFFQLTEEFKGQFELVEIGIQPQSTAQKHFEYTQKNKIKVYSLSETQQKLEKIFTVISAKRRPTFLSVDIDAFSAAFAPGCSAPSPIGLDATRFITALPALLKKLDVRGLGIYEVSPKFDRDQQTSRLAAILLHTYIQYAKI